jgi:hypothetical protein
MWRRLFSFSLVISLGCEAQAPWHSRRLLFSTCNGLANQKLAIAHAAALAAQTGYVLAVPYLLSEGRQDLMVSHHPILPAAGSALEFHDMYDGRVFYEAMQRVGVSVVQGGHIDHAAVVRIPAAHWDMKAVLDEMGRQAQGASVDVGCALGAAHPQLLIMQKDVVLAALTALVPSSAFAGVIARAQAALAAAARASDGRYDALHLRVERDWAGLCHYWKIKPQSPDSQFCGDDVGPEELVARLAAAGLGGNGSRAVYVAVDAAALDARGAAALAAVRAAFPLARARADVAPDAAHLSRELGALVDFYVSLDAERWSGNSYSTFSGLLILQRGILGRPSSWWNGGRVVLEDAMPIFDISRVQATPFLLPEAKEAPQKVGIYQ